MRQFDSDGVRIAYDDQGEGEPVLLIHGFASNGRVNWEATGWVRTLREAGRRVVSIDNRGHGESEKLYDPAQYAVQVMAEDSRRLLDHLGIGRADVIGYSMGARLAALLAIAHPDRVRRAVLGGLAANIVHGLDAAEAVADGLLADDPAAIADPQARAFRMFADQTRGDRRALAACMRAPARLIAAGQLSRISCPVLVVAGERDEIAGRIEPLVEALPDARGLVLSRRDHMKAVGEAQFKAAVLAFLAET